MDRQQRADDVDLQRAAEVRHRVTADRPDRDRAPRRRTRGPRTSPRLGAIAAPSRSRRSHPARTPRDPRPASSPRAARAPADRARPAQAPSALPARALGQPLPIGCSRANVRGFDASRDEHAPRTQPGPPRASRVGPRGVGRLDLLPGIAGVVRSPKSRRSSPASMASRSSPTRAPTSGPRPGRRSPLHRAAPARGPSR